MKRSNSISNIAGIFVAILAMADVATAVAPEQAVTNPTLKEKGTNESDPAKIDCEAEKQPQPQDLQKEIKGIDRKVGALKEELYRARSADPQPGDQKFDKIEQIEKMLTQLASVREYKQRLYDDATNTGNIRSSVAILIFRKRCPGK